MRLMRCDQRVMCVFAVRPCSIVDTAGLFADRAVRIAWAARRPAKSKLNMLRKKRTRWFTKVSSVKITPVCGRLARINDSSYELPRFQVQSGRKPSWHPTVK